MSALQGQSGHLVLSIERQALVGRASPSNVAHAQQRAFQAAVRALSRFS